ncbi:MAG: T9SS type A sorting domain-containing protein [Crocinitomicaceae bacterium]|nr:T9SS type A sorting domain-containing protein [Crocinitomicaceae bacterium]
MKNIGLLLFVMFVTFISFSQGEGVSAMAGNPQLQKNIESIITRANAGTFDSTFIYTIDTIDLPFFDEFTTNKFQQYNSDFADPGVTSVLVYRLHDSLDVPLFGGETFSLQPTFKRTVDIGNSSVVDEFFDPVPVMLGDLSSYPVTHVTTMVYPPFHIYDTVDFVNDIDTVWMSDPEVYQDSARQFFADVNDPTKLWMDSEAYHNYSMAVSPWSLGVATFDGLDEFGFPYAINTTTSNYADHLTSKPIDMSGVTAGDSLYFSFLYQPKGFCDEPEEQDSLILEFYAKDLDQWNRVWSTSGEGLTGFKHQHLLIDNADYYKKGFQFRFKNYGGLSGSLDHFHVDYVNLRALSGYQDTVIRDFAFVYPIYTLLETFTSVPWDHYKNNSAGKMSSEVKVVVRNSDNVPENEQDGATTIEYMGTTEGSFVLLESLLNNGDLNYLPWTEYTSFHDFSGGDQFADDKTGLTEEFDVISTATHQNSNFTLNDSTTSKQYFQNYYSYDDGTAEQAYGPTGAQSRLAIKYTAYEADSLIGVMMHFVPTVEDVSDKLFLLTVWDDNGGEPGDTLYQDALFFPRQPDYTYDRNIFKTYYLRDTMKLPINGTFYVGWQQFDPERLGVGLDKNIVNNEYTYYSVDGVSWNQSNIEGSVMIRPVFSTSYNVVLGVPETKREEFDVTIYPNPTNGEVKVKMNSGQYEGIHIYNIQGQLIHSTNELNTNINDAPAGVYFVRPIGSAKTYKIIKQ